MTRNNKNKKREQGTGVFQNAPFKSLKGMTPKTASPPATAPKPSSREEREDDDELFLRSVSDARRIDTKDEQAPEQPVPANAGPRAGDEEDNRELFLQAMGALNTTTFRAKTPEQEEAEPAPARSSSNRMRQLKRGTIHIAEELDLHGFLKDEALKRLEHFITNASARGSQAVLVITGKGINSPEGPVLPGAVAAWLREQGQGMVAEFLPAPRDRGGSGAIVAFLRRRAGK